MAHYLYLSIFFGVLVGSFLNVVIHRLPLMLKREHEAYVNEYAPGTFDVGDKVTLSHPRSNCPHCAAPIKWYHNIPLLSWLWLLGHSACCRKEISMQYPITELFGGLLAIFAYTHYGLTMEAALIFIAGCLLYSMAVIDSKHMLLPDLLVSGFLIAGLLYQLYVLDSVLVKYIVQEMVLVCVGAVAVRAIASHLARQEVLGFGDVKLFVAITAWLGCIGLVWVIFFAALSILVLYIADPCERKAYPFGPSLCIATILVFFNIEALNQYLLIS